MSFNDIKPSYIDISGRFYCTFGDAKVEDTARKLVIFAQHAENNNGNIWPDFTVNEVESVVKQSITIYNHLIEYEYIAQNGSTYSFLPKFISLLYEEFPMVK